MDGMKGAEAMGDELIEIGFPESLNRLIPSSLYRL